MTNLLARWLINTAIDDGRAIPAWVQRRLETDPDLRSYHDDLLQLGRRLEDDASAWASSESRQTPVDRKATTLREPAVATFPSPIRIVASLAASVAIAYLAIHAFDGGAENARNTESSHASRIAEIQPLLDSLHSGQQIVQQQFHSTRQSAASIGTLLRSPLNLLKSDIAQTSRKNFEMVGKGYGRAMVSFSDSIRQNLLKLPGDSRPVDGSL